MLNEDASRAERLSDSNAENSLNVYASDFFGRISLELCCRDRKKTACAHEEIWTYVLSLE